MRLLALLACFVATLQGLAVAQPAAPRNSSSTKTVVVIDAAVSKEPGSNQPYVQLIAETVTSIAGISVVQEAVDENWHREDAVVALDPTIVIIHINTFTLLTNDGKGETRFAQFLVRFRDRRTKFVLYSRSTALNVKTAADYVVETVANLSKLPPNRFTIFAPNRDGAGGRVARNAAAFAALRTTVESLTRDTP